MNAKRLSLLLVAMLAGLAMTRPPAPPAKEATAATPTPALAAAPTPMPPLQLPEDRRAFRDAPDALGIQLESSEGEDEDEDTVSGLTADTELTVLFPEAMVPPDRIDAEDSESPLAVWPDVDAHWVWRTQSQGVWTVKGPLVPGQDYKVRLREGLKTLAGAALATDAWGYALATGDLTVTSDSYERSQLSAQPQIPLEFTYPVRLSDAAEGIWFQDRATRRRFPAEIMLNYASSEVTGDVIDAANTADIPPTKEFRVRPREPLPVGHRYDLVVENVFDSYAGRTLPYPEVFSLGTTEPLAVDFVAARNWPTDKPHIEVKFTARLADAELPQDALRIEPKVPNLSLRREGESLLAEGDFDTSVRYKVTISDRIIGDPGFPLPKSETWGATFHAKKPTLLFPQTVLRQRAALGLRFALLQSNTGPITWKLAAIPLDRLDAVKSALGENRARSFIDLFHLSVTAQGELPASDNDREQIRSIEWKPAAGQPPLSGPYLVEAVAKTSGEETVVNQSMIFFNEVVFTQKTMPAGTALRLARMSDGLPIPDAAVKLVSAGLDELASGTTDAHGVVEFSAASLVGSAFFLADVDGHQAVELSAPGSPFPDTGSSYSRPPPVWLGRVVVDRPLYRPGEEIHFKGMLRANQNGRLSIPKNTTVSWKIIGGSRDEPVAEGAAQINAFGGWNAAWTSPPQGKLGQFRITTKVGDSDVGWGESFRVEEFRNPPFSVVCETPDQTKAAEATVEVSSQYFHGAPNVGSTIKWTATWISDSDGEYYSDEDADGFQCVDLYSENRKTPAFEMEVSGESALDAKGRATIASAAPFRDPGLRARCYVMWRVDVTGPDGQTITGGAEQKIVMNDVTLGVKADSETGRADIAFDLNAIPRDSAATPPAEVAAALFLVQTKSVKERLAPFVYRYRNTDEYVPVEKKNVPANGRLAFAPKEPGRYVLVVSPLAGQPGITVSDEIYLSGDGEAQLPVQSDQKLEIRSVAKDEPVPVGTNAAFDILTPTAGVAWVTVETDHVLDTLVVPLKGNSSRIEIPVRPGYAPNVQVSAYVLRPGGADELPGEMYGSTELKVVQPGAELALAVSTDKAEYEPRQTGKISVKVAAEGRPVPNAEITLYAVDDSILTLGDWSLPTFLDYFYPSHPFNVLTRIALAGYVEAIKEDSLTMKEVVVGEAGKDEFGNTKFVRQDFRPLILWLPSVTTGADGTATAEFVTPDNLTRFRVIALAQTKESQFGAGDCTFNVTKPLLIEPALPRFLREGDEIELRAVARQKFADSKKLAITCTPGPGITLAGAPTIETTAARNDPAVAAFRAKAGENLSSATIRFSVSGGGKSDEVEITLPIASRTITVRESTAGTWTGPSFDPGKVAPASWLTAPGDYDLTLSTSPWLAKLLGIPVVLDYPHGCFEQKSSRLLVYTALAKLLEFLPQPEERDANYRRVIEDTLREFEKSLLPDETLPYWPYGTEGNAYVTIQAAWAVAQAEQAGYDIPESLSYSLPGALKQIATRKSRLEVEPTLRAFALFVLSQLDEETDDELTSAGNELFLNRDRLTDEGRAMLAIAFHTWNIEEDHQQELIREIPETFDGRRFNPVTFSSATRAEAICTWARLLVTPHAKPRELLARLVALMDNSSSLSTQENLWLLVAFNAFLEQNPPAELNGTIAPRPDALSENRTAATWASRNLARLRDLTVKNLGKSGGAYVLAARRQLAPDEQKAEDKRMRIERVVKNLTDPARTGTAAAPFRLGDQILISFRFHADEPQSYVALEDALPAGLEVLNPNLEMIGRFYQVPDDPGAPAAWLSHSEMRDRQTNLYFDRLDAGTGSYAVLARATAAGTFAWPSTQMAPMYDSRTYARSAPSQCVVVSP